MTQGLKIETEFFLCCFEHVIKL